MTVSWSRDLSQYQDNLLTEFFSLINFDVLLRNVYP